MKQERYLIQSRINQTEMSAVYQGQDRQDSRTIAIKEMKVLASLAREQHEAVDLFTQEAKMLQRLSHPHLPEFFDFFEEQGRYYIILEFIYGRSLLKMLEQEGRPGLPSEWVLRWTGQLCDVLDYLHRQNPQKIIYRDLKPSNVMLVAETDQIKLIDFGVARFHKPGKTKDTTTFGTPGYAPPEQYGKGQTDERSDIYALGATLHHLLTGHDPSSTPFQFPPAHNLNPKISLKVSQAIAKAVTNRRESRFASVIEMKAALLGGR